MDRTQILNAVILTALFGALFVGSVDAQSTIIPARQVSEVAVAENNGVTAGFPPTGWTRHMEDIVLYPHYDTPTPDAGHTAITDGYFDYQRPVEVPNTAGQNPGDSAGDKDPETQRVVVNAGPVPAASLARFALLTPASDGATAPQFENNFRVYAAAGSVWAKCSGGSQNSVIVEFDRLQWKDGAWTPFDTSGSDGHQPTFSLTLENTGNALGNAPIEYAVPANEVAGGDPTIPNGGWQWLAGERMQISMRPSTIGTSCTIYFDTNTIDANGDSGVTNQGYPTLFRLKTDTARVASWIDTNEGAVAKSLPDPAATAPERRQFKVQVAHASLWPSFNNYVKDPWVTTTPAVAAPYTDVSDYQDLQWDSQIYDAPGVNVGQINNVHQKHVRIWDEDTDTLVFDSRAGSWLSVIQVPIPATAQAPAACVGVDRCVQNLGQSTNLITYQFSYTGALAKHNYRAEAYTQGFGSSFSQFVPVGLKGMSVAVADGTHDVFRGEPTIFRVTAENTGSTADVLTARVATPGNSWTAQVINPSLSIQPGGTGDFLVRVVPSPAATAGDSKSVAVTVSSSFPNEVQPITVPILTRIVGTETTGARLSGAPAVIEIFPGETLSIPALYLHNTGSRVDSFLLSAKAPGNVNGWTLSANPATTTIPADSEDSFGISVKAPASALPGTKFAVTVDVQRLGSTVIAHSLSIPLEVILVPNVDLAIGGPAVTIQRLDGSNSQTPNDDIIGDLLFYGTPIVDTDYSPTTTFRIEVTNPTPVSETYRLTGQWGKGTDNTDPGSGCREDGTNSGPDFWRVNVGDAADMNGAPTTKASKGTRTTWDNALVVPGMSTVDVYVQLGWVRPSGCGALPGGMAGTSADPVSYKVFLKSLTDQSVEKSIEVETSITGVPAHQGGQKFAGATHAVGIEPGRIAGPTKTVALDGIAVKGTSGNYAAASYGIVLRNEGNEKDTLVVELPAATKSGWTQTLAWVANADGGANTGSTTCTQGSSARQWKCADMLVGAEATLKVIVQPSAQVTPRSVLQSTVTVRSNDDASKSEALTFTTRATDTKAFDAIRLKDARTAPPGADVSLPFRIDNVGTDGDNYRLSVTVGDADWRPRFSGDTQVFIPGQNSYTGFLLVTVPSGATGANVFRVQVQSLGGAGAALLDYEVTVGAANTGFSLAGSPSNNFVLGAPGVAEGIDVIATSASGPAGVGVAFSVDQGALPQGWTVTPPASASAFAGSGSAFSATGTYTAKAPAGALATSRVPVIVSAQTSEATPRFASKDIVLALESEVGLHVELLGESPQTILAGGQIVFEVDVVNDALDADTITLTNTALPTGWTILYSPTIVTLGPLEAKTVNITVGAPASVPSGTQLGFTMFATSGRDPAVFDQLSLGAVVGYNLLKVSSPANTVFVAPEESATYTVTVRNNGTVPDQVTAGASIPTDSLAGFASVSVAPRSFELPVNGSQDVSVTVLLNKAAPADIDIVSRLNFTSLLNAQEAPVTATYDVHARVLSYKAKDIDGDNITEYAVDRNRNPADGFEEFRESREAGGKTSRAATLEAFLSPAARESFMVTTTLENGTTVTAFRYVIDGDKDGRVDLFIDDTGDGRPNIYWDPDSNRTQRLTIFKDVDGDAVIDYFVDVDGDGVIDKVFNVVTGRFVNVLVRDIDGDGTLDYAVDANGNGQIDPNETVLFTRGGRLVTVLKVDVDGDGKLDDVFDTDGDGRVDSFIRNGETVARKIVLRDVNGDGILDWTYDSNLDGRADSFYDPATQQGGQDIDTAANFSEMVKTYWYVPALFLIVLVLFVVLIGVTRR